MATNRLDALAVRAYKDRDGNEKTAFTKIGTAWETKNGGWQLIFDALPIPTMGERGLEVKVLLMLPKPRDGDSSQFDSPKRQAAAHAPSFDGDEVPFSPEWRG